MLFGSSNPPPPNNEKESWSSWLDRAERESWQMELLLSGFVILLLAQAKEPLDRWLEVLFNYAGTNNVAESFAFGANVFLPSAWLVLSRGDTSCALDKCYRPTLSKWRY